MKKQHLSFLLTCACCMLLCVSLTSCPPGPGPEPEPTPTPTASSVSDFGGTHLVEVGDYTFYYDSEGRFIFAKDRGEYDTRIDYEKGLIYLDGGESVGQVKFNSNGYISEMATSYAFIEDGFRYVGSGEFIFTYNNQGNLVKSVLTAENTQIDPQSGKTIWSESGDWTMDFTWENGNLTKIFDKEDFIDSDGDNYFEVSNLYMKYSNIGNPLKQYSYGMSLRIGNAILLTGLLGKGPAKLPISMWWEEIDDSRVTISYTFNDNGTISTETQSFTPDYDPIFGQQYSDTDIYTYRPIDGSRAYSVSEEQQIMQPRERVAKHGHRHLRHLRKYPNEK